MAKSKLNTLGIVLLVVAVVGVILAVVGIAVPWFVQKGEVVMLGSSTKNYGLFADYAEGSDFPIAAVQAFAIITLILTVAACAVLALNSLGIVKVKWLYRVICACVVILCAVLTFIFALVFAGQYENFAGKVSSWEFNASAGSYLLPIGAIVASVPLFFGKN